MEHGAEAIKKIDLIRAQLEQISLDLWNRPEPAFNEYFASSILKEFLRQSGFSVEENVAGIPTAFIATWGQGRPRIGYLAEYDALPGFSQKVAAVEEPVTPGAPGHACGHNLMAAAHVGAAIGLKEEMEAKKIPGTVVFYGCPAEEVLTGKVFMARSGVFDDLDCALNFHPFNSNGVSLESISGMNSVKFNFFGKASHAATAPAEGRSAADAAELMNVGANYLREHIPSDVRMHYVTPLSGDVPNTVPNRAQTWYFVRAPKRSDVDLVYNRLIDVAKGAALMTGTSVEVDLQGGCYPTLQNEVLAEVCRQAMEEIGFEGYSDEERRFATQLNEARGELASYAPGITPETVLFEGVLPLYNRGVKGYNSSDIGDVAHIVPTVMMETVCYNARGSLHNWNVAACAGHSIGRKGMIYAAKALAVAGVKLLTDPSLLHRAWESFKKDTGGKPYVCPIPDEIFPPGARQA